MVSDQIVDEIRLREQNATSAESLMGQVVEGLASAGGHGSQSGVWLAWNRVNGDVERAHTSGVYVGEPRRGGRDPELTVYVDSPSFMTDFSANHEVYLARLESVGLRFSRIEFRLSKRPSMRGEGLPARVVAEKRTLPNLTPDEENEVEKLCSALPASLRASVSQAMRVSYKTQKQEHS